MTHRPRLGRAAVVASILVLALSAGPVAAAKPGGVGGGGGGKPGYPDRVTWSGFEWQVKTSTSAVGPGPNVFSKENVRVVDGDLVMEIAFRNGRWTTAEIIGPHLGYGTYTFSIESDVTNLDSWAVLGLFTWSDRARFNNREIDIEVADWGDPATEGNAQVVVQPWDAAGHLKRYTIADSGPTVHSFVWQPDRVDFSSARTTWAYTGSGIPPSQDERIRINLWLFQGHAPTSAVTVRFDSFTFMPLP
jgi:hypothetical protein